MSLHIVQSKNTPRVIQTDLKTLPELWKFNILLIRHNKGNKT